MIPLPIDPVLPELVAALRATGAVVLHAPTGAGKTTRVPRALHDAGVGRVIVLEPRRVAARAAAARLAEELGEPVGRTVGYQVRFERKGGADTQIWVMTEGVLLARLVADPFLEGVDVVVFDEFHERSLDADLALAMVARLRAELRPELGVVVMSATLDTGTVADFLGASVVRSEGRTFPVEVRYLPRADDRPVEERVADHAPRLLAETGGDVLVFLPGAGEIARSIARLGGVDAELVPLHGRLTPAEQDRALRPSAQGRPRIVLATNVAETSVTLPSVRAVLDVGLVRVARHDPRRGLDKLGIEPNSRASADQRAGRAGRVGPGVALRLWTEAAHRQRPEQDTPEVRRVDLAGPALALLAWGEPDPRAFRWFEAPLDHALDAALRLLRALGAVDAAGALTPVGRAMARLPAHPRIGRVLVAAHAAGVLDEAAIGAALLEERAPMVRARPPEAPSESDLVDWIAVVRGRGGDGWRPRHPGVVAAAQHAGAQLARRTRDVLGPSGSGGGSDALRRVWLAGWPDRLAVRRTPGDPRLVMANGRGGRLMADSGVTHEAFLIALDVADTDDAEARVHLASGVDRAWLPREEVPVATWDAAQDRVVTAVEVRIGPLVLERRLGAPVAAALVEDVLCEAVAQQPRRAVPLESGDFARALARVRYAARCAPQEGWPSTDLPDLAGLARDLAEGCRSLADLHRRDWAGALLGRLDRAQRRRLDELAPERLRVPSGSEIGVDYPLDGPPVLAVRMQELFGISDTPKIGGQPVMLHLLAPNGRPQQVTQDLAGFWARTWPEVRKELRARYPKHAWPDDPTAAPPQRRPGR